MAQRQADMNGKAGFYIFRVFFQMSLTWLGDYCVLGIFLEFSFKNTSKKQRKISMAFYYLTKFFIWLVCYAKRDL